MASSNSSQAPLEVSPGEAFPKRPVLGAAETKPFFHAHFGFQRNPFPVVPDATGFYFSRHTETIVVEVLHAIESRKGFMVITGEVGLGKTTLSRRILRELEDRGIQTALVFNTFHQGAELLREINKDFGLEKDVSLALRSHDLQSQLAALNEFLLMNLALGVNCAVIIDDAQQLSMESLELVRQVSNLETDSEKLVQILLVGQPELDAKLKAFELRQLESRIVLKHVVSPFTLEETRQYVPFKLKQAGGDGRLRVTPSAFRLLHRLSGGNPRQINILMDRCLYAVVAFDRGEIDRRLLRDAARDAGAIMPHMPRLFQSKLVAQFSVLLLVLSLLGVLLLNSSPGREKFSAHRSANDSNKLTVIGDPPSPAGVTVPEFAQHPLDTLANTPIYEAPAVRTEEAKVVEFLRAYKLEEYSPKLMDALTTGWMDEFAAVIRRGTGLRLVRLAALPDWIAGYPVLKLDAPDAREDEYLLFWRSEIWSEDYDYRYVEVQALQSALRRLGFYEGDIDGLAGPLTSKALRRFQSSANLRPSGLPDTATLFLLEHSSAATAGPGQQDREGSS